MATQEVPNLQVNQAAVKDSGLYNELQRLFSQLFQALIDREGDATHTHVSADITDLSGNPYTDTQSVNKTVASGTSWLQPNLTVDTGYTWTINGALHVTGTLTVNGTLTVSGECLVL